MRTVSTPGLENITAALVAQAQATVGLQLDAVFLYGSYARGDYDMDSDIDFMILINCPASMLRIYQDAFDRLSSRLSLQYDITVSITLRDSETYNRFRSVLPFYSNIDREGIQIA